MTTDKPTRGGKRPGAGRPATGRTTCVLRLSNETIERLDTLAATRIEQAELIDGLVKRYFERARRMKQPE